MNWKEWLKEGLGAILFMVLCYLIMVCLFLAFPDQATWG